jgi:hypothetical protein
MSDTGALANEGGEIDEVTRIQRQWQGRFDRLLQEKKELEKRLEEGQKAETDAERYLRERQEILDRKERVLTLATEKGLDPERTMELLGLNGEDDEDRLDTLSSFIQTEADARLDEEIARRFPKSKEPPKGPKFSPGVPSYAELMQMQDSELQRLPPFMVNGAVEAAKKESGGGTLRQRIERLFTGGSNG